MGDEVELDVVTSIGEAPGKTPSVYFCTSPGFNAWHPDLHVASGARNGRSCHQGCRVSHFVDSVLTIVWHQMAWMTARTACIIAWANELTGVRV